MITKEEAKEAIREAYGNSEYTDEIIKALEQEPILDKIRAEIESIDLLAEYTRGDIKRMALATIDKYKAGSEE